MCIYVSFGLKRKKALTLAIHFLPFYFQDYVIKGSKNNLIYEIAAL